jgi:hypothetical protein
MYVATILVDSFFSIIESFNFTKVHPQLAFTFLIIKGIDEVFLIIKDFVIVSFAFIVQKLISF